MHTIAPGKQAMVAVALIIQEDLRERSNGCETVCYMSVLKPSHELHCYNTSGDSQTGNGRSTSVSE